MADTAGPGLVPTSSGGPQILSSASPVVALPLPASPGLVPETPVQVNERDPIPPATGVFTAADQAALDALVSSAPIIPSQKKNLTDTVTQSLITVDMSKIPDGSSAFTMSYAVECTDGTNTQIQSGLLNANLARAASLAYASNAIATGTANTVTSGGMTVTFSWDTTTSPNFPVLRVNANSSLVPTKLNITFYIPYATHPLALSVAP